MKIYSYIRMEWDEKTQAYKIIESVSEEYHGEVAQCGFFSSIGSIVGGVGGLLVGGPVGAVVGAGLGGILGGGSDSGSGGVSTPGFSQTEQALQREQLRILQQQQTRSEQMDPHVLRSMGLINVGGEIRPMQGNEWVSSMAIPERQAYERQQEQSRQQATQYRFQEKQWRAQQDRWEQADASSKAMRPFLLESMGLVEKNGTYRRQTEKERYAQMTTLERGQHDLTLQMQERQRMAYAGELPISPALEKSLRDQESQIAEALSRRLGANWQLTTPGQQAMGSFSQRADLVREEARRGEISTQGGLLLSNLGYLGNTRSQQTAQRGLFSQAGQIPYINSVQQVGGIQDFGGAYANYPQVGSGAFSGYGSLQQPHQQQRQMQLQANVYNQQAQAQQSAGLWGGLGSLAGAGIQAYGTYKGMAALAAASSRTLKDNIKTIKNPVDQIMAMRGVDFVWKTNGMPNKGVIAEELEKIVPEAIFEVDGIKGVEYHQIIPILVEAIKVQQQEIAKLKERI